MSKKRKHRMKKTGEVKVDEVWEVEAPPMVDEDGKCPYFKQLAKPSVYITTRVWQQIMGLTKELDHEWLGYLKGTDGEHGIICRELIVPEQDAGGAEAETRQPPQTVVPAGLVGWVHSHVSMGAFFSSIDDDTIPMHRFSIVVNKRGEYKAALVVTLACGTKARVVPEVYIGEPLRDQDMAAWLGTVKGKVHERTYGGYTDSGYGQTHFGPHGPMPHGYIGGPTYRWHGKEYTGKFSIEGRESVICPWQGRPKKARKKCPVKDFTRCVFTSQDCPFKGENTTPAGGDHTYTPSYLDRQERKQWGAEAIVDGPVCGAAKDTVFHTDLPPNTVVVKKENSEPVKATVENPLAEIPALVDPDHIDLKGSLLNKLKRVGKLTNMDFEMALREMGGYD